MTTLDKIIEFIEKAGFEYVQSGNGLGQLAGLKVNHYQKSDGPLFTPHLIQLGLAGSVEKPGIENVVFSSSIPQTVRDQIYALMNDRDIECQNTISLRM